ncbi:uncharacterized protein LOC128547465 [Mercenaria mercenaria]|uniref:uncharacterized protein LOC128547465 n=1 Tax=Mercenaria mercenaria TaxID=6596 RepID=UPI00234F8E57|nr:uncharacterized protein LOC128547465 [Mercenaria mercenaria]
MQNVCWEKMMSWKWPLAYESIAGVFIPASWAKTDLQDIATLCHIWENCKNEFMIRPFVISNLRDCRNKFVAHNPKLSVNDVEKSRVFDALKDLLKVPDVQLHINAQECLSELAKIENGDTLSASLTNIFTSLRENNDAVENLQDTINRVVLSQNDVKNAAESGQEQQVSANEKLGNIQNMQYECSETLDGLRNDSETVKESLNLLGETQNRIASGISDLEDRQTEANDKLQDYHNMMIKLLMKRQQSKKEETFVKKVILSAVLVAVISVLCYNGNLNKHVDKSLTSTDCISENYKYPFEQDMPLLGYFRDHKEIVGREWLFETSELRLITPHQNSKGIALIAEMGYGKSAFVSHLLCSREGEKGYGIKSHVVAFHICKFDVESTKSAGRFIRRLIGFLAREIEEYGNIISILSDYNIIYNIETCDNDPIACFDQGIIFPLEKLSHVSNFSWIFIIEALDECYLKSSSKNPIMELLSNRIRQLPVWFKVFITSRNMTDLYSVPHLEHIHLLTNEPRNIRDIREYIKTKWLNLSFYIHDKELEELLKQSEGNFLFVVHAIQYMVASGNQSFVMLPSTLEDVYELNFDRQYGDMYSFQIPKIIFEVICATTYPLKWEKVLDVLLVNNVTTLVQFNSQIDKMSFFLRMDSTVTIIHQSLYRWLINARNKKYRISLKAGHAYMSRYLLNKVLKNNDTDLADLSIHVSEASDDNLTKQFLELKIFSFNITNVNESLHNVISKTSAVIPLKLLISLNLDVNKVKDDGTTPAFAAAGRGNMDQLELLQEKGADINFVKEGSVVVDSYDILNKIDAIKQGRYYGYGLIHVAARHGHPNVVRKLLEYSKEMTDWKTSLGQRASDIACEVGNLKVAQSITEWTSEMLIDCIYYASKRDNVDIIQYLIAREEQITLDCISDTQSIGAIQQIQTDDSTHLKLASDFYVERRPVYHKVYPLDKWWIVAKETPLLAAIRAGSVKAASLLIKHFPSILNCSDSFGYSPLLLSVMKNQYTLLPLLKDHIFTERCEKMPHHIQQAYHKDNSMFLWNFMKGPCLVLDGLKDIEKSFCSSRASFAHFVARYDRKDFLRFALQENIIADWNTADDEGIYPIHYAARYTNVDFITIVSAKFNLNISTIKCRNGSTAYHITATTPSFISLSALTNEFRDVIPDVKDENEMGILHYSVLFAKNFKYLTHDYRMFLQTNSLYICKYLVELCKHNIQRTDVFGRNILHYALINGHFSIIEYIESKYGFEFRQMLSHLDVNNQTPVHYAITNVEAVGQDPTNDMIIGAYFAPNSESYFLNQFESCFVKAESCVGLRQAWEIAFIFAIRRLSPAEFRSFIEPILYQFLIKSRDVSNAILIFHKHLTDEILRKHILQSLDTAEQPMVQLLKDIARYRPSVFNHCGQPLKWSPLHYLALKDKCLLTANVVAQLRMGEKYNNSTWKVFNCTDERGFTVFHYAMMRGDFETAFSLLGDMEKSDVVNIVEVIMITILRKQRSYQPCSNIAYTNQNNLFMHYTRSMSSPSVQEEDDKLISSFIRKYRDVLQPTNFCKNNSKTLSVVHYLFTCEMKNTLKTVVEIYGREILNCMNSDQFTPRYIGKLFDYKDLDEFFDGSKEMMQPFQYAEKYLVLLLLSDILRRYKWHEIPDCVFQRSPRVTRLYLTQIYKDYTCIERYLHLKRSSFDRRCKSQSKTLLGLIVYSEDHTQMTCFDVLRMIKAVKTMLNELPTCMYIYFHNLPFYSQFEMILYKRLAFQFSEFGENLHNCNGTEQGIHVTYMRLKHSLISIRNLFVYTLKRQRALIIRDYFGNRMFDMHYIEVFSDNGFGYLLSKMSIVENETESLARWVSKEGWKLNYLNVLRKTPAYRELKAQVGFRYRLEEISKMAGKT